ncbi:hypothetical protein AURDEDRAFT_173055 [Auricularia subglabra TFB-10046 SS5]|uniref:Uncharacterized protein n=1 Tax=Auricularia subglabra (strain TFB-10046 / SS5) TaxID=717982 RepID=J0DBD0_AURST|nr:hypothetical protein AURDEDRAFT_173055 [Auricularia subglabra TFB-10046 SS5]
MKLLTIVLLFLVSIVLSCADALWIHYYVHAGTHPNPRIAVNATHEAWNAFSVCLYIYGFLLATFNTGLVVLLPFAITLSTGPFIAPWVVMPVMQKHAWDHRCETWPVEVVLVGRARSNAHSTATFFINGVEGYQYGLYEGRSFLYQFQEGDADPLQIPMPTLQNVTYDLSSSSAVGVCLFSGQKQDCVSVNMDLDLDNKSYLRFEIDADLGFGVRHYILHAIDRDWQYSDDAPSMILRDEATGESVLRTAVTKPGDCTQLKVCVHTTNEARMLVPIGLLLIFQEKWAAGTTCGPKKL